MSLTASSQAPELHLLLQDEREKYNQLKQFYQSLKEEHCKVKSELISVHEQLKDTICKHEKAQALKDERIQLLDSQLFEKQQEIVRLSEEAKAFDAQKIRDLALEEAAAYYEERMKEAHAQADRAREAFNSLHYEHALLRCTLESREKDHTHQVECLKLQHQEDIQQLQAKIEQLEDSKSAVGDSSAADLNSAKHEILQLSSKLRAMHAEEEELRARNEILVQQLSNANRSHLRQMSDNLANIRMLESEKQKAVLRKDILEKEISIIAEEQRALSSKLQASKKELLSLRNKMEDSEQKSLMLATDLKLKNEHLKAEHETEKQHLLYELSSLKEVLKNTVSELETVRQISATKEEELNKNLVAIRQHLWMKSNHFNEEKEHLEKIILDLEDQKENLKSELSTEVDILRKNMKDCIDSKLELEKQNLLLRGLLENTRKDSVQEAEIVFTDQNKHFLNEIKELKDQVNILKASYEDKEQDILSKQKVDCNGNEMLSLKLKWEEQKHQFSQRIEALESQLKESKCSFAEERKELDQKIQHYIKVTNKFNEKLELCKVKNEDLEQQIEIFKNNVPPQVHQEVLHKLLKLQRRLDEYGVIIAAEPHLPFSGLLTDIQNLQLRFMPAWDSKLQGLTGKKSPDQSTQPKRCTLSKRSFKTRDATSPNNPYNTTSRKSLVTSSSSDLENS